MAGQAGGMDSGLPKCKVYFRWECNDVKPDEAVRVVGNSEELGNWQPSMGKLLRRDSVAQDCWTSTSVSFPIGRKVQYKYVICTVNSSDVRWEAQEDNRTGVATGQRLVLEDDLGKYRHIPVTASKKKRTDVNSQTGEVPALPRLQSFEQKLKKEQEIQIDSKDTVFAVFRTLPVQLRRSSTGAWEVEADREQETINFKVVSMMARALPTELLGSIRFVGHPGVFTNDPDEQRNITEALAPYNCIPVFIDEQVVRATLEFCHRFLWPVMHNMKVFDDDGTAQEQEKIQKFDEAQWKTYQVFNRCYAEAVEAYMVQDSKAIIWIHDFYLLLMPRALKLRCPTATTGLFLHSAFPSSEVMRCIPPREEILKSMLSCKVVTFQIFEYARHFLSCCQLLLNATYYFQGAGVLHIEHESESVVVRADHFVIPYKDLISRVNSNTSIQKKAQAIRKEFGGKMIFAAIDGDEPFSGLVLKLRAFQKFLSECPQHVHRVALNQHILARRAPGEKESELVTELRKIAEEMNRDFGQPGQPAVVIREGDVTLDDRLAILQAADVFFDTSINDGLNLHPFLFIAVHAADCKGSLLVSEFSGCSSVLIGARKVNPWNTQATMDAMHTIVTQEEEESNRHFKQDESYVSTQRLSVWVHQNLSELKMAATKQTGPVKGLGAGRTLFFMERGFRHLSAEAVLHDYRQAKTRAILLDNEGTLAPDRRSVIKPYGAQETLDRAGQPLDPQVLECLQALANDRSNTVMVISGRGTDFLEQRFGDIKDLGLCAEHGFYWVPPGKGRQERGVDRWKCMQESSSNEDDHWKTIVEQLMQQYVKRVQGSVLESKGSSVAWNYRKVGAQVLANDIALELARFLDPKMGAESLLYGYPVVVVNGKGYVEVKRADVDKGVAADRVLSEMREKLGQVDFILCIGDDRSDEDMFEVVNNLAKQEGIHSLIGEEVAAAASATAPSASYPESSPRTAKSAGGLSGTWSGSGCTANLGSAALNMARKASITLEEFNPAELAKSSKYYTVTVGRKPSKAGYFVRDVQEVSDVLQRLALQAKVTGLSRFSSMPMLARAEDGDSD